jgi:hypothetical protein
VIERGQNALAVFGREHIEHSGHILWTDQTQEDLEGLLLTFTKESVELFEERTIRSGLRHTASGGDLSAARLSG